MQILKKLEQHFVACYDLNVTHIYVPPFCQEWLMQLEVYFIRLDSHQIRG